MAQRLGKEHLTEEERDLLSYVNMNVLAKVLDMQQQGDQSREALWEQLLIILRAKREGVKAAHTDVVRKENSPFSDDSDYGDEVLSMIVVDDEFENVVHDVPALGTFQEQLLSHSHHSGIASLEAVKSIEEKEAEPLTWSHENISLQNENIPNHELFQHCFKVTKWNPEKSRFGRVVKKERIWQIDFFNKRFVNYDLSGKLSFDYPSNHIYRIERNHDNARMLRLLFHKAPHPYDLLFESTEKAMRFFELAVTLRRATSVWTSNLCQDQFTSVTATISLPQKMKSLSVPSGTKPPEMPKLILTRLPHENCTRLDGLSFAQEQATAERGSVDSATSENGLRHLCHWSKRHTTAVTRYKVPHCILSELFLTGCISPWSQRIVPLLRLSLTSDPH